MSSWQNVTTSNVGRAAQDVGAIALYWLKLLEAIITMLVEAVIAFSGGWLLLQSDKALPAVVRQFCLGYVRASGGGLPVAAD
jgi:hypothetical protein